MVATQQQFNVSNNKMCNKPTTCIISDASNGSGTVMGSVCGSPMDTIEREMCTDRNNQEGNSTFLRRGNSFILDNSNLGLNTNINIGNKKYFYCIKATAATMTENKKTKTVAAAETAFPTTPSCQEKILALRLKGFSHMPSERIQKQRTETYNNFMASVLRGRDAGCSPTSVKKKPKYKLLPSLGTTSFLTILTLVCLETVLLSTVSNCAKTFYMHWNTSNSIFRIDNTDHIIDVNKGNLAFEFDQVHIICPVYEPGTYENETEKYIIYNVSKVEYETCRITNADPRVIAICDKPHKLMFFTITFRPFTPQPGGLEFLPGNDYYFISTSSKDDLYRRIGGRCSTNNMKVVFKVCCPPEEKNKTLNVNTIGAGSNAGGPKSLDEEIAGVKDIDGGSSDDSVASNTNNKHKNNLHNVVINGLAPGGGAGASASGNRHTNDQGTGLSINTNIDQFNRIPITTNGINIVGGGGGNVGSGVGSNVGMGVNSGGGILLTPGHVGINMIPGGGSGIGVVQYPGQTGIRINTAPPQQHGPLHKINHNDDHYHHDKHPNEVVKNEELTYNSAASSISLSHYKNSDIWRLLLSTSSVLARASAIPSTQRITIADNNIDAPSSSYLLYCSLSFFKVLISNLKSTILYSVLMTFCIQYILCSPSLYCNDDNSSIARKQQVHRLYHQETAEAVVATEYRLSNAKGLR